MRGDTRQVQTSMSNSAMPTTRFTCEIRLSRLGRPPAKFSRVTGFRYYGVERAALAGGTFSAWTVGKCAASGTGDAVLTAAAP